MNDGDTFELTIEANEDYQFDYAPEAWVVDPPSKIQNVWTYIVPNTKGKYVIPNVTTDIELDASLVVID